MSQSRRPPLSLAIESKIEDLKRQTHAEFWPRLQKMQELTESARAEYRLIAPGKFPEPPPPPSPNTLRSLLLEYAVRLILTESEFFPSSPDSEFWLRNLSERITGEVLRHVRDVEAAGKVKFKTLCYHGLTLRDMAERLQSDIKEPLNRLASEYQQKLYNETARHLVGESRREETLISQVPIQSKESMRKGFIEPLLLAKGWSMLRWALEAEVAYNTVADYLAGKKNPHSRTRVKLAKVLDLTANQLPN